MITVGRALSTGKFADGSRNEDRIVSDGAFRAVIDGATAKDDAESPSPGARAADAVVSAIENLPADATAREAVDAASAAVLAARRSEADEAAAGALIFSSVRNEVWVVGDGWVCPDGVPQRFRHEIEQRGAAARAALVRTVLGRLSTAELQRSDPGRAMIAPLLRSEHLLANVDSDDPLCFGRIDGRPVPDRFIQVLTLDPGWSTLVLASDGYPTLESSYAATEAALQQRLDVDPLLVADPPETKGLRPGQISFDDRTWLELQRP